MVVDYSYHGKVYQNFNAPNRLAILECVPGFVVGLRGTVLAWCKGEVGIWGVAQEGRSP
jgi:hypothetical protein